MTEATVTDSPGRDQPFGAYPKSMASPSTLVTVRLKTLTDPPVTTVQSVVAPTVPCRSPAQDALSGRCPFWAAWARPPAACCSCWPADGGG